MLGIGREPERSSSPIPLLEQEHLNHVTQERVLLGFESLQRKRLHNPPGQPDPVFCHPHCKNFVCFHTVFPLLTWQYHWYTNIANEGHILLGNILIYSTEISQLPLIIIPFLPCSLDIF